MSQTLIFQGFYLCHLILSNLHYGYPHFTDTKTQIMLNCWNWNSNSGSLAPKFTQLTFSAP